GDTCALALVAAYRPEPIAVPGGRITSARPPWQSVQPNCTVPVECMVALSVAVWQVMQPALFRSACSLLWPHNTWSASAALDGADCARSSENLVASGRQSNIRRSNPHRPRHLETLITEAEASW